MGLFYLQEVTLKKKDTRFIIEKKLLEYSLKKNIPILGFAEELNLSIIILVVNC